MAWYDIFQFPWLLKRRQPEDQVEMRHAADEEVEEHTVRQEHEYGTPGNMFFGQRLQQEDYNPKFLVPALFDTVHRMKWSDSTITAALLVLKLPILRTEVRIIPGKDQEPDAKDKLIAEVCTQKLLLPGAIHETWQKQIRHFLMMLEYGFSVSEKVWTQDDDGFLRYSRIAPRLSHTITDMVTNSDGSLRAVIQSAAKGNTFKTMRIPCPTYGMVMSWEKEGENHWGRSVLRAMYKHWFYKESFYRMDAVRLDRWAIGIPEAIIKENYSLKPQDRADLERTLKNMRGGEQAYVIHPEQIDLKILTPEPGGSTDLGLMNSIYHHDLMIYRSILAHFIATANAEYGNYGSTRTYAEVFFFAEQALANYIEEEYNEHVIKPFCDANFNMHERPYPRLQFADVQKFDMGILSEALSRLGLGGFITPDDDMESFLRKSYGWPQLPEDQRRAATGIQNPAKGLPTGTSGEPIKEGAPGRPTTSDSGGNQKVDQRPVQRMSAVNRILAMQERLLKFIDGEA